MFVKILITLVFAAGLTTLANGRATAAPFYEGKTLTVLINLSAGGPTDIEGRMVMRHLGRLIDGNPTIVVKNMTGAGGLVATNFLGERAESDGLTLGFFTWEPLAQVLGESGLRVKYNDFVFIAGMQSNQMTYIRKDVPPGIEKPSDLAKAGEFRFAGLDVTSTIDLQGRMVLDLLGAKYRYVTGYKGLAKTRAAVVQNEVQMAHASLPSYYGAVKPVLVDPGTVIPLYQYGVPEGASGIKRSPGLPDVPTFLELYDEIHGKPATGKVVETVIQFVRFVVKMNRTIFLPPGSPKEATTALKTAFDRLSRDKTFLDEYRKMIKTDPVFISEEEGTATINELADPNPKMVTFIKKYVDSVR